MKETKVESATMKWLQIDQRSSQQHICWVNGQPAFGTNAPVRNIICAASNVTPQYSHSHQKIIVLFSFAIKLTIASVFALVCKVSQVCKLKLTKQFKSKLHRRVFCFISIVLLQQIVSPTPVTQFFPK